ncbi:RNA polymerase alpha subunit C-terminal domain-containing protein [Niabella insulamsoli]|uniref:RNA polymerase alpha subunit C-terminal domain-containing protein n=1 Tax=Niabella insulamsoli TaxID=3144874 RepID=UPI0031FDBD18
MIRGTKTLRTCPNGHRYYKSSDCPICPVCEQERQPAAAFLSKLSAPARRALESEKILSLKKLATYAEKQILALHGIGKTAIPVLRTALKEEGLDFKA